MANDLIAKLKLDGSNFDTNINKSKRYVKDFDSQVSGMATAGIKAFGGLAAGVLAGAATLESFQKIIDSTQTTADAFARVMEQSKSATDLFFTSIAKGDFSNFINGFDNAIKKAGEYADKQDDFDTKTLFTNKELSDLQYQKKLQDNIARDKTKSDAERNAALIKSRELQKEINELSRSLAVNERNLGYAGLNSAIADQGFRGKVPNSMWDSATKESNRQTITNTAAEIARRENEIKKESRKTRIGGGAGGGGTEVTILTARGEQLKKDYEKWLKTQKGQTALFYKNFLEMDDAATSEFGKAVQHFKNTNSLMGNISDEELNLNMIDSKINGSYKSNNKPNGKPQNDSIVSGSIASDRKILNDLRTKFENTTDEGIRDTLRNQIYYLELEVKFKETGKRDGLVDMLDIEDISDEELDLKFDDWNLGNDTKQTSDLDYISSMTELMSNLSTATNGATSNWFQYTSGILTGIGQMLPQLWALLGINTNLAIVQSAMKTPFPLNLIALASTASAVMGAMVNIPKFADGGIIGGSNFLGDNMIARVNSGEMILNNTQQGKLFGLLNSGSGGAYGSGSGEVKFKITGKDLEGVLSNYKSKMSRI